MSEDHTVTAADLRGVVIFAAFVYLAIRFIDAIAQIILVFAIILLVILILNPVVTWLERRKIPRVVSAFMIVLLILGVAGGVAWLVVPRIVRDFWDLASSIPGYLIRLRDWLGSKYPTLASQVPTISGAVLVREAASRLVPFFGGITGYAASIADVLISVVVILISTIYGLSNPRPLIQGFLMLFPQKSRQRAIDAVQEITAQMRSWAIGTGIGMFLIFLLTWVTMVLLGVRSAFLIGLVAGILEIVPVLGPFIAGTFATLVALGQDPHLAIWVLIAFIGIQQAEGHLIIPLVMSGQLQLHPISVIFAVLVMGGLFGLVGVFLATPVAAVMKVLVYQFYVEPKSDVEEKEIFEATEQVVSGAVEKSAENDKNDEHSND